MALLTISDELLTIDGVPLAIGGSGGPSSFVCAAIRVTPLLDAEIATRPVVSGIVDVMECE